MKMGEWVEGKRTKWQEDKEMKEDKENKEKKRENKEARRENKEARRGSKLKEKDIIKVKKQHSSDEEDKEQNFQSDMGED